MVAALLLIKVLPCTLLAQRPELPPKPFKLTQYDRRIPADAWMSFSIDVGTFMQHQAILKAVYDKPNPGAPPPKALLYSLLSGKLKLVMPYPIIFGIGGDPKRAGNAPDNNPALIEFLKVRSHFGFYLDFSAIPAELVGRLMEEETGVQLTKKEVMGLLHGMKVLVPPGYLGAKFKIGIVEVGGAIYDQGMAKNWPGKGVPKSLLDVLPRDSIVVAGTSLDFEKANEDLRLKFAELLKVALLIQKLDGRNEGPANGLEQLMNQIDGAAHDAVGMDAKGLLKIFNGDLVVAFGANLGKPNLLG